MSAPGCTGRFCPKSGCSKTALQHLDARKRYKCCICAYMSAEKDHASLKNFETHVRSHPPPSLGVLAYFAPAPPRPCKVSDTTITEDSEPCTGGHELEATMTKRPRIDAQSGHESSCDEQPRLPDAECTVVIVETDGKDTEAEVAVGPPPGPVVEQSLIGIGINRPSVATKQTSTAGLPVRYCRGLNVSSDFAVPFILEYPLAVHLEEAFQFTVDSEGFARVPSCQGESLTVYFVNTLF